MKKLLIISFIVGFGLLACSIMGQAAVPNMIAIREIATAPATPAATHYYIYALSADSTLYGKGDDGTAHDLEAGGGGSGATTFLELTDTPDSYTDQAGKYAKVNVGEDALEFGTPSGAGDMTKATYDTDADDIADKAESVDDGAGNSKTAAQIKTHIDSTSNPHSVTYTQAGAIQDAANTVKDTHIDWGSGASQVDTDDVPAGSTNKYESTTVAGTPLTLSNHQITFNYDSGQFELSGNDLHIKDIYLLNTGDVGTGVYDFGGATSLEIVNGTSPTVDAAGEVAVDTDADGNLIDQGLIVYHDGTQKMYVVAVDALPSNDDYALCYDATADKFVFQAQAGGGGSKPDYTPYWPAEAMICVDNAYLERDTGTNDYIYRIRFDASIDEKVYLGTFPVPSDIDAGGTVTFFLWEYAVTAAADKAVVYEFQHRSRGSGESWDVATTAESSGAKSVDSTQDQQTRHTWTETVSNLGWAANDQVQGWLMKDADNGSDTLASDDGVTGFGIIIPRS